MEWLGYATGLFGIFTFVFSMITRGKNDGEQLARIEVNGLNIKTMVEDLKGELDKVKIDQSVSKTFRDKYEEPIKDLIKSQREQEKINNDRDHVMTDLKDEIQKLNRKFDRMMELFNRIIGEKNSDSK